MGLFNSTARKTQDNSQASGTDKGFVGGLIQCNASNDILVQKYPYNDIKQGAVIKVHQNQRAMLFSSGQRLDTIGPGREVVVDSANIPCLGKLLNVATGGETTYTFEVWFINMTCERNVKLGFNGKSDGVRVSEINPRTGKENIFPINGFGSYRFKISNPEIFIDKLVGTEHESNASDVLSFFEDQIKIILGEVINQVIVEENLSPLEVLKSKREINDKYRLETNKDISNAYGIEITNFSIRLNSSAYDEYIEAGLAGAKKENELSGQGRYYDTERQYDIMHTAAGNQGAGNVMGVGMGFGMGNTMGNMMGQMMGQMNNQAAAPSMPPPIMSKLYHVAISGQAQGPFNMEIIRQYIAQKVITPETLVWTEGMSAWATASLVPELASLFNSVSNNVPPIPPKF